MVLCLSILMSMGVCRRELCRYLLTLSSMSKVEVRVSCIGRLIADTQAWCMIMRWWMDTAFVSWELTALSRETFWTRTSGKDSLRNSAPRRWTAWSRDVVIWYWACSERFVCQIRARPQRYIGSYSRILCSRSIKCICINNSAPVFGLAIASSTPVIGCCAACKLTATIDLVPSVLLTGLPADGLHKFISFGGERHGGSSLTVAGVGRDLYFPEIVSNFP